MINQPKNTRRLFIGFNLPDSDLEICEEVLKNLKDRGIYNITKLANIHITLCFLGNVKSELLIEIIQKFDNQKFELDNLKFEFNNFQVKYSTKRAMLWATYFSNKQLDFLHEITHQTFGVNPDHKFSPHVTFCRSRVDKTILNIHDFEGLKLSSFSPRQLCLFETKATKKGVQYELLSTQKLIFE
jgi:2'-5' RNA ligase